MKLSPPSQSVSQQLHSKRWPHADEVPGYVERLLKFALESRVSDLHCAPRKDDFYITWRLDGVMQEVDIIPKSLGPNLVGRLKVLAELLTYRIDIPQEGRIRQAQFDYEMRVSTFPTMHGEKAVVRFFAGEQNYLHLGELGYRPTVLQKLQQTLTQTSGVVIVSGPAGSGKTTSIYACMREIAELTQGKRSLVSIEDPIEVDLPEVDQSQVNLAAGFDLAKGLRSLVRQDPDVILVGEIRDQETAEAVFQTSLIGHLVLTTFHAGSSCLAINRLLDMGIEPYLIKSGLLGVISQRLVRKLCKCAQESPGKQEYLEATFQGCKECLGTGYRGRQLIAEFLDLQQEQIRSLIKLELEASLCEVRAMELGMETLQQCGQDFVSRNITTMAELKRVLGNF